MVTCKSTEVLATRESTESSQAEKDIEACHVLSSLMIKKKVGDQCTSRYGEDRTLPAA